MVFKKIDLEYLKLLTSSKDHNKEQIKKVIQLYEQRKIPRRDTAELLIYKLQSKGKTKNKDALKRLDEYDKKEPVRGALKRAEEENIRVRIIGKRKAEAVEKIKQKFREFKEPKIQYKNLDRALAHVEFSVDHLKTEEKDLTNLFSKIKEKNKSELNKILLIKSNVRVSLGVHSTFVKQKPKDPFDEKSELKEEVDKTTVKTPLIEVYSKDNANSITDKLVDDISELFDNITHKGTGWSLKKIHYVFIETYDKKAVRGSSYIPTPEKYSNAKCGLINIQNDDQECFKWCMKYHRSEKKERAIESLC